MSYSSALERIAVPWVRNLEKLGIRARMRVTDPVLFQKRTDEFDFDVTVTSFPASQTPGNELLERFSSAAADQKGSDNVSGVRDPAVDALIERLLQSDSRTELLDAEATNEQRHRHQRRDHQYRAGADVGFVEEQVFAFKTLDPAPDHADRHRLVRAEAAEIVDVHIVLRRRRRPGAEHQRGPTVANAGAGVHPQLAVGRGRTRDLGEVEAPREAHREHAPAGAHRAEPAQLAAVHSLSVQADDVGWRCRERAVACQPGLRPKAMGARGDV